MLRGDVVTVAVTGDYGKPRPAVIVQSDAVPADHHSVVVCQLTSTLSDAKAIRVTLKPSVTNGLRLTSQIMVDKPTTVRRERIGTQLGRLSQDELRQLNAALAFVMGLAD